MMEQLSLALLLTQQYLPLGEKAIQFGQAPTGTFPKSLLVRVSYI
jgi:hypothetical protein